MMKKKERSQSAATDMRPEKNSHTSINICKQEKSQSFAVREAALRMLPQGLSVIPVNEDKKATIAWKPYQSKRMLLSEVERFFKPGRWVAVVAGAISGNLECIDFDKPPLFYPFFDLLEEINLDLVAKLVKVQTLSGGYHLLYRCEVPIEGNQKLATSRDGETWIETRGEGGYFVSCPSPGYELLEHDMESIQTISGDERETLLSIARSFSDTQATSSYEKKLAIPDKRPGDSYNEQATFDTVKGLLEMHGWRSSGRVVEGNHHFTRPGKPRGTSATLKETCLYVFSTNAGLPTGAHSPFSVYAYLEHQGDFFSAAKSLACQGYGVERNGDGTAPDWEEPDPFTEEGTAVPYPIDALPDIVRAAVEEVHAFVKAPVPLVAACALAPLSLAAQAHYDVKRADQLTGPTSLFFLVVADSGERKSTCDGNFTQEIKDYEREQAELGKSLMEKFEVKLGSWKVKKEGVNERLRQLAKKGISNGEREIAAAEGELLKLAAEKPARPKVPRLLRGDETSESLAMALHREWPSAGVIASEAGLILGSHSMNAEAIMRNLALLNTLWDGGRHSVGRRTTDSFILDSARFMMALQVQGGTLRAFMDRSGALARGIGFFARFLIVQPESTQGYRLFSDPPKEWPALSAFNQRIREILSMEIPMGEGGRLSPGLLRLEGASKEAWVLFHDKIERELRGGGKYFDARDAASKVADNAARLAANFHFVDPANNGKEVISWETIDAACLIAEWHLNEALKFFEGAEASREMECAESLERYLVRCCLTGNVSSVSKRTIMQKGPRKVRKKGALDMAIDVLVSKKRARLQENAVEINPQLLET